MRLLGYGLGLMMAGAVLHASLAAQVRDTIPKKDSAKIAVPIPPRADSLLRDSLARIAARDSARAAFERGDTIKAPIARAELPMDLAVGRRFHWTRDSLFATGAVTVADLLERVTGMTMLHAGWISAPAVGSYLGDTRRIRLFYDGYEYQPLDPRAGGTLDLTQINLWSAEEVTIEQAPEEIRVYLRSWRVTSTTPETRTDVATGDQATNMYRGFFGRRFRNGLALQFGAQQFGTTPPSITGTSSDQLGVVLRAGWSNARWSVDGFMNRTGRHRGTIARVSLDDNRITPEPDSIPSVESTRAEYYFRVGYADPDTSRFWAQAMAVSSKYDYTGIRTLVISNPVTPEDSAINNLPLDTAVSRSQYILTAGTIRGPLRLSATDRVVAGGGKTFNVPSIRASFTHALGAASVFAEGKGLDSVARVDLTAQFNPLPFVSVLGSVGRATDDRQGGGFTADYARIEGGFRVKSLWLLGGAIRRDSVRLPAPAVFNTMNPDSAYVPRDELSATGATLAIRGRVWKFIQADAQAIRWSDSTGFYRPRYQTRSELFVRTNMLDRFPSGNLGILASIVHEYRSATNFPVTTNVITMPGYRTLSWLLEIRILNATVSWQFRNLLGERYEEVPGLFMPRQTNFYGVRWTFFD